MNITRTIQVLLCFAIVFVACSEKKPPLAKEKDRAEVPLNKEGDIDKLQEDNINTTESKFSTVPQDEQKTSEQKEINEVEKIQFQISECNEESIVFEKDFRANGYLAEPSSNQNATVKKNVGSDHRYEKAQQSNYRSGQLTAGEINDFSKWKLWEDVAASDLAIYQMRWRINPSLRFATIVQTSLGAPIADCKVELIAKGGKVLWTTRTDNTGKAELWQNMFGTSYDDSADFIRCSYMGKTKEIKRPKLFSKGVNSATFDVPCDFSDKVDILFAVDATGSMGDEIEYLKTELSDIIRKTSANKPELEIQLGTIFYRCPGNSYVTKQSPFSTSVNKTVEFIAQQNASEGGTEAVETALHEAVNNYAWSTKARTRILFMVLDEPPGVDESTVNKLHTVVKEAAAKGIRIVPLVSSGVTHDIDKSLEYLMRSMALATNGTYAFLTDHSGIGNSHTAPSTDSYKVEKLNDLMIRIIDQFTDVQDCKPIENVESADSTVVISNLPNSPEEIGITMSLFPNPAHRYVNIQSNEDISEVWILDSNGKLIIRSTPNSKAVRFELDEFTNGFYIAKCKSGEHWHQLKFVISK